ncbi:MAG: alpha/beta fold hydrolase [Gammaproteobacteria bacterium]|jgi:esterase/lipase superfamily enzyme|nr:alpha/beta fold hydrolase [Gammaproteobacteria bacterium]
MKSTTKRLLWALFLLLLLLAVGSAYYFYTTTTAALERAENADIRHMQVARVGDQGAIRFFFATNRQPVPGTEEQPLVERFGQERADDWRLGYFDTLIEPSLGLGRWLDASRWFLEEEIKVQDVRSLEPGEFADQLRPLVAASPHRGLLLLVHGLRTDIDFALRGTAFLAHVIDIDAPVMVFDWPGNQGPTLSAYRRAQAVATASGADLAAVLRFITAEIRPERLWILANSLGSQVVVEAVHRLYQDPAFADAAVEIDELVLSAPDVSKQEFNARFRQELSAVARNTTVYISSNDRALLLSRFVNRERRLGESTLTIDQAEMLDGVAELMDLVTPDDDRVTLVDVTAVNRTRNFHNFSLEVPEFFDDIYLRLANPITPLNRLRFEFRTPEGKRYSVLTRDR